MGFFANKGETWGNHVDTWWPASISAVGSVVALAGPYIGQLSDKPAQQAGGLIVGIVGALAASVAPVFETFRHKSEIRDAEEEIRKALADANTRETESQIRAREEYLFLIDWMLSPLIKKLAEVLVQRRGSRRMENSMAELKQMVLSSAQQVVGADPTHVRANYFSLQWLASDQPILRAAGSTSHPPRNQFSVGSEDGRQVFDMLASNGYLFCFDVLEDPPVGWDSTKERPYRTFISVTVQCDTEPVGMLTVDAREPGELDEGDVALIQLLGVILAISESQKP